MMRWTTAAARALAARASIALGKTGLIVVATACAANAYAQPQGAYPNRPVRFVVPLAAGGAIDIATRLFAQKLAEALGQQFVIDNRPGAGGIIGADIAAKAPPDGYTLMMGSISHTVLPALHKKLPYDIVQDFAPVSMLVSFPFLLLVHPSIAAKSVPELIALAKAKPGQIHYASGGNGSTAHLSAELFKSMTGINLVHVPYKGTGPALNAFLAGETGVAFYSVSATLAHVKSGRLRALATTGKKRSPSVPDVPTAIEAGVANFETGSWAGTLAPAGTPRPIIVKLHGELMRILALPEAKERIAALDFEPVGSTPEQFAAEIRKEVGRWAKVVKESGAKLD
ncbi:MAG: tripartite tricarboxylate transporter substrate binding protein [Burkholderiales bacterium]|nr:tripartite tricarboxylate transporter substrate binding protein [Burkholderiales bacterium]